MNLPVSSAGLLRALKGLRLAFVFLSAFLVHSATLYLGALLPSAHPSTNTVWPATGAALALLLLWGYRMLLPIALSILLAKWGQSLADPAWMLFATSRLLIAASVVFLMRRAGFSNDLGRSRDFWALLLLPSLIGGPLFGGVQAYFFVADGHASAEMYSALWFQGWAEYALGAWSVTPFILLWFSRAGLSYRKRQIILGAMGYLFLALLIRCFITGDLHWGAYALVAPVLLWIHSNLGSRGAMLATGVASVTAAFLTSASRAQSLGPFQNAGLFDEWAAVTGVALANLLLCAVFENSGGRSEEAAAREARYRTLLESTTDVLTIADIDGTIRYESPSVKSILGYTPDERIGTNIFEAMDPRDTPAAMEAFARGVNHPGRVESAEFRYRHKNGQWCYLNAYGTNHLLNPAIGGVVITSRDVTDRRMQEDRLRALSTATEQSPVSIVITDVGGRIEYVNRKFEEVTGFSRQEAMGSNPRILKSGEQPREFYEAMWKAILDGQTWKGEFHNKRKGGELFWESATISPIKDESGKITHFLAIKEDITEKRRLEEQYRQAQKMEAVGQLAGGVAHDFNNLLTVILGYTDMFLQQIPPADPMHAEMLEMKQAGQRAAKLTGQLLAFSRRQVIQPKSVDLNQLLKNFDPMARRLLGENIELVMSFEDGLPPVRVDVSQIEQVLINLVVNARDAMPSGGKIVVSTRHFDADEPFVGQYPEIGGARRFVCFEVSDTGTGMTAEVRSRVFEPFFTTKPKGKGTGLGLSTVYGIVKQLEGFIYVDSEPGKGTTFRVLLPPSQEGIVGVSSGQSGEGDMPHGGESVAVVEDETVVRSLTVKVLRQCGYRVEEFANGEEAWQALKHRARPPDLVVSDLMMPLMGGKELGRILKEKFPQLKMIFMSGYTDQQDIREGRLGQADEFLQKPFSPSGLAQLVRRTLDGRRP